MVTADDTHAALEIKVAELVDTLMEIFADEDVDAETIAQSLTPYADQVADIGATAAAVNLIGLHDVCMYYQELLTELGQSGQTIDEEQQVALEEWPMLVMSYLESPTDMTASTPLIEHLQNPVWITPLPEDDAELLQLSFALGPESSQTASEEADDLAVAEEAAELATAEEAAELATAEEAAALAAAEEAVALAAAEEPEELIVSETELVLLETEDSAPASAEMDNMDDLEPMEVLQLQVTELVNILMESFPEDEASEGLTQGIERYNQQLELIATSADDADLMGLNNVCLLFQETLNELADSEVSAEQRNLLEEWPTLAMGYLESPNDPEAVANLLEHLKNSAWPTPLPTQDSEMLQELFGLPMDSEAPEQELVQLTEPLDSSVQEPEQELGEIQESSELDEATQELVDILALEVTQLCESLDESLAIDDQQARHQALADHAEDLERLADGAEAVGMEGLQQSIELIYSNLLELLAQKQAASDDGWAVLQAWPLSVQAYLQAPQTPTVRQTLVRYLQDPRWPDPLPETEVPALAQALIATSLVMEGEEAEARQRHAQVEDITLELPEDVNQELVDSLLQELPQQTADFSAAIQNITAGSGTLADVEVAQRIAHTVKGAANTVGIKGIANLTHHLEDILIAFSKHQAMPTRLLADTLTNAGDCLETMSESLMGLSEPPTTEESLGVLQEVLDWANRIDQHGVPQEEDRPKVREFLPGLANRETPAAAPTAAPAAPTAAPTAAFPVAAPAAAPAKSQEPEAAVPMLRVPANLVDELLRLAGETMIMNGQLQDRLQRTSQQIHSMHEQNLGMQQLAAELEELVDIGGIASQFQQGIEEEDFDPLEMDQYNELHTVSRRLIETATDAREMNQQVDANLSILDGLLIDQERLNRENEETITRTRMVPVKTIAPRLQRSVRQACRLIDKEVELHLVGEDTLIDSNVLNDMIDPLMHLLRNAVDHGIELPEERALLGKNPSGAIVLEFARSGNNILVRCRDDGAGLNYANIRHTAIERGLIGAGQTPTEEELARLILQSGFSTRTQATQVSGRGIGMDAVYNRVLAMKGALRLESQTNQGCLVELKLPVTLMSAHGLLVRAGKQILALSERGVEQILYSGSGELGKVGEQLTYQLGDEIYEATELETLLNLPSDQRHEERLSRPALLVEEESGARHVVLVQEVMDSRELVVKNLGPYVPAVTGLAGATILGDGSAAPVLDLSDLLRTPTRAYAGAATPEELAPTAAVSAPMALVVDDSLSARRALAEFVKDLGFEVRTAIDGLDAVAIMDVKTPDILLVDMEMPRMNGLELTAHARNRSATKDIPIIMITSRSTEKHRREAQAAGVDRYVTKPFTEDELLGHIQRLTTMQGAA